MAFGLATRHRHADRLHRPLTRTRHLAKESAGSARPLRGSRRRHFVSSLRNDGEVTNRSQSSLSTAVTAQLILRTPSLARRFAPQPGSREHRSSIVRATALPRQFVLSRSATGIGRPSSAFATEGASIVVSGAMSEARPKDCGRLRAFGVEAGSGAPMFDAEDEVRRLVEGTGALSAGSKSPSTMPARSGQTWPGCHGVYGRKLRRDGRHQSC